MPGIYAQWIDRWERKLATRDTNRVVRPFEWGTEWLRATGFRAVPDGPCGDEAARFAAFARAAVSDSDRFFAYTTPADFQLQDDELTFASPAPSGCAENDVVHARWFPAADDRGRALVLLPQWNAGPDGHIGLAKLLNRFGISALRMTMAYHAERKPAELLRADYHVSSNVGRTVHAGRQSVIDVRACLDWLEGRGYRRLGILGTSLGSCIAFIAMAHDARVRAGIFNHVSMNFGDVVWTGIFTGNVRQGFEGHITQEELRECWAPISPASYIKRMVGRDASSLLLWARHDTTFLPVYSRQLIEGYRALGLRHRVFTLPCAHYTTGEFPFNIIDGLAMCRFAARNL